MSDWKIFGLPSIIAGSVLLVFGGISCYLIRAILMKDWKG